MLRIGLNNNNDNNDNNNNDNDRSSSSKKLNKFSIVSVSRAVSTRLFSIL